MTPYVLAPDAASDLFQIWHYLKREASSEVPDRMEAVTRSRMVLLANNPGLGHFRRDLTEKSVKFFRVYLWLIIYRPEPHPLQIASVLHASRDVSKILGRRIV